jgi:hypothetical protein
VNIAFPAGLTIVAGGFLLLERTDDSTVSDIAADLIYTGGLNNDGEALRLYDATGKLIDTANVAGGAWPGGDNDNRASMERLSPAADSPGNWGSNNGFVVNGHDAEGNPIRGTPRQPNSSGFPTPTPAPFPGGVLLNEFLPHPDAGIDFEFIELFNAGGEAVDLSGWQLDDAPGGSSAFTLPEGLVIQPGTFVAFYRSETGIALNDDGDTARLLHPDGSAVDEWSYERDPGEDVSWARFPDGASWNGRGLPTPGGSNRLLPDVGSPSGTPVPIGVFRQWNDGAWATLTGRVSVSAPTFGRRLVYLQDETGGIAAYLARGDWPSLAIGQSLTVFGYMRHRQGETQIYLRNTWHVHAGPAEGLVLQSPLPVLTGQIGDETEGWLVTVSGRVVRLESQAFWLDDGSGAMRVFFSTLAGWSRPRVRRGEWVTVTGVVTEATTARDTVQKFRVQPRTPADVFRAVEPGPAMTPAPEPTEILVEPIPTEEPTATAEP